MILIGSLPLLIVQLSKRWIRKFNYYPNNRDVGRLVATFNKRVNANEWARYIHLPSCDTLVVLTVTTAVTKYTPATSATNLPLLATDFGDRHT